MAQSLLRLVPLAALLALASACPENKPRVVSPAHVVRDFSFTIEVLIPTGATFDPSSDVTLNGVAVPVSGGPSLFSAPVTPGFPLEDHNRIEVRAVVGTKLRTTQHVFQHFPDKARVHRIDDPDDLIAGPLAHGRVGDWLIENSVARFIVQDVAQRDLYSVGGFGGNLIDPGAGRRSPAPTTSSRSSRC